MNTQEKPEPQPESIMTGRAPVLYVRIHGGYMAAI
jgi:hypothetical protein